MYAYLGVASVAEEAAELTPAEAVVSGLVMGVVGDHAVVASLARRMRGDDWTNVGAAGALGHACWRLFLNLAHALLSASHVGSVALILVILSSASAHEGEEPFALLSSSRLV